MAATNNNEDAGGGGGPVATQAVNAVQRHLTLILVRHGETAYNATGRIQGHLDVPLSSPGQAQAQLLARRLRADWSAGGGRTNYSLPGPPQFWFSSDLSRASETALTLQKALVAADDDADQALPPPLITSPLLRERYFGSRQGLTGDDIKARFGMGEPFDGETESAVWQRMTSAFAFVWNACAAHAPSPNVNNDTVALVAGHGGTLRALLCFALGAGAETMNAFRLGNTSVSIIEFKGTAAETAKGSVVVVNDTAHLSKAFDCKRNMMD